ncbi:hypothetical protein BXO8_13000 [Xanthomonas oryzae pv. oryzae]|nr:hypothetical protein BXO8_13000 [Xanthomonas oryzae pv. oryzae]
MPSSWPIAISSTPDSKPDCYSGWGDVDRFVVVLLAILELRAIYFIGIWQLAWRQFHQIFF